MSAQPKYILFPLELLKSQKCYTLHGKMCYIFLQLKKVKFIAWD